MSFVGMPVSETGGGSLSKSTASMWVPEFKFPHTETVVIAAYALGTVMEKQVDPKGSLAVQPAIHRELTVQWATLS